MGEEKNKGPNFPLSGVFVLLAALGVITFTNIPFQGSRPSVPEVREPFEKVRARLWQDPFLAVLDHAKAHGKSGPVGNAGQFGLLGQKKDNMEAEDSLANMLKEKLKKGKVTVLGVMEFGAPYAEETEMRIRNRYAVLSGLRRSGFEPDDPEHIDFITVASRDDVNPGKISLSNIMPFEWLKNTHRKKDPKRDRETVLLLWLNDDVFQGAPLARLARLADCLGLNDKNSHKLKENLRFKIIGPAGSTTLRKMVAETTCDGCHTVTNEIPVSGMEIYSATATVASSMLLRRIGEDFDDDKADVRIEDRANKRIEEKFKDHGIIFKRTICSDKELAKLVIEELSLRGVDSKDQKDHLVLIAEWDTYYGRSLPVTYDKLFSNYTGDAKNNHVHSYSYMRGLDGSLPGDKEDKESEKPQAKNNAEDTIKRLEQPSGKSQYDYLRRLADEIYRLDQRLKVTDKEGIKAIGVLGSDFHDKLLVLQALRQRFPDAIFFTTDLDARLLHPDKIEWTRNLIVASNFHLALRSDIQGDVPPFRDNYQTSVFFAILKAFSADSYLNDAVKAELNKQPSPRIFEIGRYKAFDLTPGAGTEEANIHPTRHEAEISMRLFLIIWGIVLLLGMLLVFASITVKKAVQTALAERKQLIIAGAALSLIVVVVFYFGILGNQREEPFSFFQGVSIWPTVLLRVLATVCSFYFLWQARASLDKSNRDIAREFALQGLSQSEGREVPAGDAGPQDDGNRGNPFLRLIRFWDANNYDWEVCDKGREFTMDHLWAEYLRRDSWRSSIRRLAPILLIYVVLCITIMIIDPPVSPVRGPLSYWLDKGVIGLNVVAFIALTFYVFDLTRICGRFIDLAADAEEIPAWSPKTLKLFAVEVGEQDEAPIKEWLLVHLIAKRTDVVGKLIFYPFVVWGINFFSRLYYFDNWQTPIGLAVVISMGAVFAWSSAFVLRRSAERARTDAVHQLKTCLASVLSNKNPDQGQVKRIEFVLKEVSDIREGAFAPFIQHPAVQALLVPFGGVGGVYLIEFLAKLNI